MLLDKKVTIWLALGNWDLLKPVYILRVYTLKVCTSVFQNRLGSWHFMTGCLSTDNLYIWGCSSADNLTPLWSGFIAIDCFQSLFYSVMNKSNFSPPLSFFLHTRKTTTLLQQHAQCIAQSLRRTVLVTFVPLRADLDCCMGTEMLRYCSYSSITGYSANCAFLYTINLTPVCDVQRISTCCSCLSWSFQEWDFPIS